MFIPKFFGEITNGVLALENEGEYKAYLSSLVGKVEVIIQRWHAKRTNRQNAFYWSYLKMVSDDTGFTDEELHELFKQKFLDKRKLQVLGEEIEMYPSTTRLTKKEFAEYMEKISLFCEVPIPDPLKVYAA